MRDPSLRLLTAGLALKKKQNKLSKTPKPSPNKLKTLGNSLVLAFLLLQVANLKKTIKVTTAAAAAATSQDPEQHLTELREPAPGTNQRQASKKTSKAKG